MDKLILDFLSRDRAYNQFDTLTHLEPLFTNLIDLGFVGEQFIWTNRQMGKACILARLLNGPLITLMHKLPIWIPLSQIMFPLSQRPLLLRGTSPNTLLKFKIIGYWMMNSIVLLLRTGMGANGTLLYLVFKKPCKLRVNKSLVIQTKKCSLIFLPNTYRLKYFWRIFSIGKRSH